MGYDFPITTNIYTINDVSLGVHFALHTQVSPSGVDGNGKPFPADDMSKSYYHEHNVVDCPQNVQDAINVVKAHLETKAKEEYVNKGVIFN